MIKVIFVTVLGLVLSSGAAYARKGNGTFVLGLEEAIAVNQKAMLDAHNADRALHHAPALKWNAQAAAFAHSWAARCVFKHSGSHAYGENLYLSSNWQGDAAAVKSWYSEIKQYNFGKPGFSTTTGHATQVLWKSTTSVGCAVQHCPSVPGFGNGYFVQCNYSPPGNVLGQFPQNVLPQ